MHKIRVFWHKNKECCLIILALGFLPVLRILKFLRDFSVILENKFIEHSILRANSADDKLIMFSFYFSQKIRLWFMQIFSRGDSLHKISNLIFWGKWEKYFKMSSAEIFAQHAYIELILGFIFSLWKTLEVTGWNNQLYRLKVPFLTGNCL